MILFGMIFSALMTLIVTGCYVLAISFTIWMMIDAGKQNRFWWLTVIIGVPLIGPAVYYFTEKKHEYQKAPIHHIHESETEEQHERAPKKKKTSSHNLKEEVDRSKESLFTEELGQEVTEVIESKQK